MNGHRRLLRNLSCALMARDVSKPNTANWSQVRSARVGAAEVSDVLVGGCEHETLKTRESKVAAGR